MAILQMLTFYYVCFIHIYAHVYASPTYMYTHRYNHTHIFYLNHLMVHNFQVSKDKLGQ